MRPRSAFANSCQNNGFETVKSTSSTRSQLERPATSFITRNKVLKSSSTAYQTWLRRSNEYGSSSVIPGHPREYKSVETFNLRSGCQVTKSPSQLQVRIDPDEFFNPKLPKQEAPMKPKDMEIMIRNLQEQVKYLTVYLDEERLHHAGTKKRAKVDVENTKTEMMKLQGEEIERILKNHMQYIEDMKLEHLQQMQELEEDMKKQYEQLEKEYKMLQASFKNYRSKISDELAGKWKIKEKEFEWEKQRAIDNAVDNMRRAMEERFAIERREIKSEYKESMQQLMNDQRKEMEDFLKKMGDGKSSIEELKQKADKAEALEAQLCETKEKLKESNRELKKTLQDLKETKNALCIYENKFEEKVAAVEDKYRKRIDDLVQEVADTRVKLISKAETLYHERFEAEELQKKRTNYAKEKLEEKIMASTIKDKPTGKPHEIDNGKGDLTVSNLIVEDMRACGDHLSKEEEQKPVEDQVKSVPSDNIIRVSFKNLVLDTEKVQKSFSLPPKKIKSSKTLNAPSPDLQINDEVAALTLAGPDKIRPHLPMTAVCLLDTASFPADKSLEKPVKRVTFRSQSPDVIF